ncbi:MAG: 4Fe-4S binding protein [Tepidanaerobacteraceae bacterium]|nr:4Fe-4S binding protein [Tepidanaerobacteraceae bacterium]
MTKVEINEELCKGCGLCINFCPSKVLNYADYTNNKGYHPAKLINPEKCTGCTSCYLVCPDCCFEIYR